VPAGDPVADPAREPLAALVEPLAPPPSEPPPPTLSYTALSAYAHCGYRFYLERVLRLPAVEKVSVPGGAGGAGASAELSGAERGVLIHALLERLDFRRPARPSLATITAVAEQLGLPAAPEDVAGLVEAFAASPLRARLAAASDVRREESFAFLSAGGALITGVLDVAATEADGAMLVVDYKSDRLDGADPAVVVDSEYSIQRLIYALAALTAGAERVEVAHVFLERPEQPVTASFTSADRPQLEVRLAELADGVLHERFAVSEEPCLALCNGCPGEGGLCSWPLEMTRRQAIDRLF
jgi:ATP-dependent exoDNAse (exonuclease V) beta subunit